MNFQSLNSDLLLIGVCHHIYFFPLCLKISCRRAKVTKQQIILIFYPYLWITENYVVIIIFENSFILLQLLLAQNILFCLMKRGYHPYLKSFLDKVYLMSKPPQYSHFLVQLKVQTTTSHLNINGSLFYSECHISKAILSF